MGLSSLTFPLSGAFQATFPLSTLLRHELIGKKNVDEVSEKIKLFL
jgi:hypothetical protein